MRYGTYSLLDTLATKDSQSVWDYGLDRMWDNIRDLNEVHNEQVAEMFTLFMSRNQSRIDRYGNDVAEGEFIQVAEDGVTDAQITEVAGYDIGYPLRDYEFKTQWTKRYLQRATPAQLTEKVVAMQNADVRRIKLDMLFALHHGANYSFMDALVDKVTLPVKALLNADGQSIPRDEFGTAFNGATHTHYLGRAGAAVAAVDIQAGVNTVAEHALAENAEVTIVINNAQAPTITAMTANFDPLAPPLLAPGPGSSEVIVAGGAKTNPYQTKNRLLGVWDGYVYIWVKPWALPGYIYFILTGGGDGQKILRMREDELADYRGLRQVENDGYPLGFQGWAREFGIGVQNRAGAAILYTGGNTYVEPSLSL